MDVLVGCSGNEHGGLASGKGAQKSGVGDKLERLVLDRGSMKPLSESTDSPRDEGSDQGSMGSKGLNGESERTSVHVEAERSSMALRVSRSSAGKSRVGGSKQKEGMSSLAA